LSDWDGQVSSPSSVALHVRRGDYVSDPVYSKKYRVMDVDYYRAAVAQIESRVADAKLFVFSDDLDWCREHLAMLGPTKFVDGGGDLADFRLMSRCSHHIISNSTFAWWAAWLGTHQGQVVVAPKEWFWDDRCMDDLFPEGWILT
jgi:hypothetical protein